MTRIAWAYFSASVIFLTWLSGCQTPTSSPNGGAIQVERQNEDCLYLNVWTGAESLDERRPVMLWIHDGALITGFIFSISA